MSKEKPIRELKLSELVDQSLNKGVVPIVQFADITPMLDEAHNQAIDDAIKVVQSQLHKFNYDGTTTIINDSVLRLSQLKKPIPQTQTENKQ